MRKIMSSICSYCGKSFTRKTKPKTKFSYCNASCQMNNEYKLGIRDKKEITKNAIKVSNAKMKENNWLNSKESREKLRKSLRTENSRRKASESKIGNKNPMFRNFGKDAGHYEGGAADYRGWDFDKIKQKIKERDNLKCRICRVNESECKQNLRVHHLVPYKCTKDNSEDNLLTVCSKCHGKIEPKFFKIKKIIKEEYSGEVYNFSVEEDESYNAGGLFVHNCRSSLMWVQEDIEVKHKYVKRTGSPGNYRYWYTMPDGSVREGKPGKEDLAIESDDDYGLNNSSINQMTKLFDDKLGSMSYDELKKSGYNLDERYKTLGLDKEPNFFTRKMLYTMAFFNNYSKEILSDLRTNEMKANQEEWSGFSTEKIKEISTKNELAYNIGLACNYSKEFKSQILKEVQEVADYAGIKEGNSLLKRFGLKERFSKVDGSFTTEAKVEEIPTLTEQEYRGIKYRTSEKFFKNADIFEDKPFDLIVKTALDQLPEKAIEEIKSGETSLNFVTRTEVKLVSGYPHTSNITLGFYREQTKQIYLFPPKKHQKTAKFTYNSEKMKVQLGEEITKKVLDRSPSATFTLCIIHELAHAVSLNRRKIQENFMAMKRKEQITSFDTQSFVSGYAMKDANEDFAETFASYAMYRKIIKPEFNNPTSWIDPLLLKKYQFVEELW